MRPSLKFHPVTSETHPIREIRKVWKPTRCDSIDMVYNIIRIVHYVKNRSHNTALSNRYGRHCVPGMFKVTFPASRAALSRRTGTSFLRGPSRLASYEGFCLKGPLLFLAYVPKADLGPSTLICMKQSIISQTHNNKSAAWRDPPFGSSYGVCVLGRSENCKFSTIDLVTFIITRKRKKNRQY